MTTGERIKMRRKELGISAEILADMLSVSPATIYRYEKGDIEKLPSYALQPIAEALNTTPAYLMGWEENNAQPAPTDEDGLSDVEKQLLQALKRLTPDQKLFLLAQIKLLEQSQGT